MKRTSLLSVAVIALLALVCPRVEANDIVPFTASTPSTLVNSDVEYASHTASDSLIFRGKIDDGKGGHGLGKGGLGLGKGYGKGGKGGGWLGRFASRGYADLEFGFMQYGKENGVESQAGDDGGFEYELTPRLTVGAITDSGLGLRTRMWDFSHTANTVTTNDAILVDALVWDVEMFERIDIDCNTSIEWSGGMRYTDYREEIIRGTSQNTEGVGGVVGLQVNRAFWNGELYGRGRFAMMLAHDGARAYNAPTNYDLWTSQTEIALGYEAVREMCTGTLVRLRAGFEWQQWDGYGIDPLDLGNNPTIGFSGFVLGAGIDY